MLRCLLLLLLSFPYDRKQANYELECLVIGFADVIFLSVAHNPLSLKKCASKMVALYGYLWMDRPFFKRILLTALFERAHSSQNALVSWLRTHKVRHQVNISACVNVHASIYCTSDRFCSTWLWNPSEAEEEVFSWRNCLHLFLYILSVPWPSPLTSRYN